MMDLLGISIVTYRESSDLLEATLRHLGKAIAHLAQHSAGSVTLTFVDNGGKATELRALLDACNFKDARVIDSGGNVGYGKAHNLAITASAAQYHLVMNPDVWVAEDALTVALDYLKRHPDVVALSPYAEDGNGEPAFLCKRYPAVLDLLLRGFAPPRIKARFRARLDAYENRILAARVEPAPVDLISGCFMLCRTEALRGVGGFNPAYFLYFEDFSLSLELRKLGRLAYMPACRIVHFGGNAGKKGLRHIGHFLASAFRFYNHYGWKVL